jgi:hypothetical protein
MRTRLTPWLAFGLLLVFAAPAAAVRSDAIWARSTNGAPITLDGVLNEPAWALAESTTIIFGPNNGVPGSGFKYEGGSKPADSTYAVLKFLTVGNQLYLGATVPDKSIGGSELFNRFDGFLMDLKNHNSTGAPKPNAEYLYSWWYPSQTGTPPPGQQPSFKGLWAELPVGSPRTPEQIANWDAVTKVRGLTNSDAANDTSYTVEMRFNLTPMGYDITTAAGDIVEWNISIYDTDWFWPITAAFSSNRVWLQDPWGGDAWYGEERIHAKPSVTIASGPAPVIQPELILPNAGALAAPVIDGALTDPVWAKAPHFDIRYGDDALRASYPGVAKHRSGQFQPTVNAGQAFVSDGGDATVSYIVKGDWLYFGFDVRDKKVQYIADPERWDGFRVILTEKTMPGPDWNLLNRQLTFHVGVGGAVIAEDYLPFLRDNLGGAQVALQLKAGTTVPADTLIIDNDTGYTAELAVDLTKLGYPSGLGDGVVHLGIDLLDADNYPDFHDSYATRTWWMRERENVCCPIWAYADPTAVVAVGDPQLHPPGAYVLLGAAPNPIGTVLASVRYQMAERSRVSLETYDPSGRMIERHDLGVRPAGLNQVLVPRNATAGIVFYRLRITDPESSAERASLSGKLTFLK